MTKPKGFVLLPRPKKISMNSGQFLFCSSGTILCEGDASQILPVALEIQQSLLVSQSVHWSIKVGSPTDASIIVSLDEQSEIDPQGYELKIRSDKILLKSSTLQGLFYGAMTLRQILRQRRGSVEACSITDSPDFKVRGVMLDVSRDKVMTLETLYSLIDELAELKTNHLQLYMEHTFAYQDHAAVWSQASPYTSEDILKIQAYCRERFIELVPNQNSFGHMHRWLEFPRYRPISECPDGFVRNGVKWEPFSLCPIDPGSVSFLDELYGELLPNFTSNLFNVGCDETFELGLGRSHDECEKKGKGRVYLEFILKIHDLVKKRGRTTMFWGDIILKHPELIPELPEDLVVLNWGYGAQHPYKKECPLFEQSGIPFYVCPGTSTWQTIGGWTENSLENIDNAAHYGLKHGALGMLNTDWGDFGHWQYQPIFYLGLAAGASLSWAYKANKNEDYTDALSLHVFKDASGIMGKLAYNLGSTNVDAETPLNNRVLFRSLQPHVPSTLLQSYSAKQIESARKQIESSVSSISEARMNRPDAALIRDEFLNAARLLSHACKRGLAFAKTAKPSAGTLDGLIEDLRAIVGEHRRLWSARNRVGGLSDSVRRFQKRLKEYAAGELAPEIHRPF